MSLKKLAGNNRHLLNLLVRYEIWRRVRLDRQTRRRFNELRQEARDILQKREEAGLPVPEASSEDRYYRAAGRYSRE